MAKVAIAYLSMPNELFVVGVYKAGLALLPKRQYNLLEAIPTKGMKLDGDEYKEMREKYFNQSAEDMGNFLGSMRLVKYFLNCRLMDAKRLAIKGRPAPNFEGKQTFSNIYLY
jgi:hypothetical protein